MTQSLRHFSCRIRVFVVKTGRSSGGGKNESGQIFPFSWNRFRTAAFYRGYLEIFTTMGRYDQYERN
jgi:hypothetical protein